MKNSRNLLLVAATVGVATVLSGCAGSPYLERRDAITIGAGDAVARNRAIHTINPRPRHAFRTHIHTDGERMNNAMEAYRDPNSSPSGDDDSDTRNNNANQEPTGLSPQ